MINNITEDRCSFEVSKLLKEKGFNLPQVPITDGNNILRRTQNYLENCLHEQNVFRQPTHALAIKWTRENFGIYIHVAPATDNRWLGKIHNLHSEENQVMTHYGELVSTHIPSLYEKSSEEATETVLLYTLKELI